MSLFDYIKTQRRANRDAEDCWKPLAECIRIRRGRSVLDQLVEAIEAREDAAED